MTEKTIAPYGSWKSPITSDLIVSESIGIGGVALDGEDVYWLEMRPSEGGRNVLVRRTPDGQITDVTPASYNVRTRVHEYGGAAFVISDGVVYFSNFDDQRVYYHSIGDQPQPLTPAEDLRYADGALDKRRRRMIYVREDHTVEGREAVNTIVALDLDNGGPGDVLVGGNDFYSNPRLSPDGTRLAWLTWNHPHMPWDGCELWVADVADDGTLDNAQRVPSPDDDALFQPEWSPDGVLYVVSDRTGWWNLYRLADGQLEAVTDMEVEFGTPQWQLGATTYGFASPERIVCAYNQSGTWHIANVDTGTGNVDTVPTPFTELTRAGIAVPAERVVFGAGSPTMLPSVVLHSLTTPETVTLRQSNSVTVDEGYISTPESIEFPTEDDQTAYAFFYPPKNKDFTAPAGERPPVVVWSHGGPTGATSTTLSLGVQYWTSRGIGVLDVNYGGSTGYGTEYRRRLNGRWGIVDVDDCVNAVLFLVERGDVDVDRLAIKGGSAGGYTTLAALTFRDVFKAGASYYGISDLEALAKDTHKFESRYMDTMIGPYPERRDVYIERSPIHHTDQLSCPIVLFQGLEDKVVLPNQAEMMFEALREKGVPVSYVPFEGEQHGFRRAENIKRSLDGELYFYSRVFGFELADEVQPIPIENLL